METQNNSAKSLGNSGEKLAAQFLQKNGYRILATNHRTSRGEIDIIAEEQSTLCFVEVKSRRDLSQGSPFEAISLSKQRKLSYMAAEYLYRTKQGERNARFDVVGIVFSADGSPHIELIKNAFEAVGL